MKFFKMFFLIVLNCLSGYAFSLSNDVSSSAVSSCAFDDGVIAAIKKALLEKDINSLEKMIEFPLKAKLVGKETVVSNHVLFSKYYLDEDLLNKVRVMNNCDLGRVLEFNSTTGKIHNLVIDYDAKDAIYSSSGIASAKRLSAFINTVTTLAINKNFSELAKKYKYPFYIDTKNGKLVINSEADFVKYGEVIADDRFVELLKDKAKNENFEMMPRGLMLTSDGGFWILGVRDDLFFEVNGGFSVK